MSQKFIHCRSTSFSSSAFFPWLPLNPPLIIPGKLGIRIMLNISSLCPALRGRYRFRICIHRLRLLLLLLHHQIFHLMHHRLLMRVQSLPLLSWRQRRILIPWLPYLWSRR